MPCMCSKDTRPYSRACAGIRAIQTLYAYLWRYYMSYMCSKDTRPYSRACADICVVKTLYEYLALLQYIHTYIHTYIHPSIHTYIHTHALDVPHTYIHTYIHMPYMCHIRWYTCYLTLFTLYIEQQTWAVGGRGWGRAAVDRACRRGSGSPTPYPLP